MKTAATLARAFVFAALLGIVFMAAIPDADAQAKQRKFGSRAGAAAVQQWSLVQEKSAFSYINRSASNRDIPINNYDIDFSFDPSKLAQSRMVLVADVSSMFLPARAVNVDLLEYMQPSTQVARNTPAAATFMSSAIKRKSGSEFVAEGGLRVGSKSKAMAIPFSVTLDRSAPGGMMIILKGSFTANRADFATENYASTGQADVPIKFELALIPAG